MEEDGSFCGASCSSSDQISVDKLSDGIEGKLKVDVDEITNSRNDMESRGTEDYEDRGNENNDDEGEEDDDDFAEEELLAQMGYAKSEPKEEEDEGDDFCEELVSPQLGTPMEEQPEQESVTTALASLNLVSALKGSRSKEGEPAEELHVSWAPDVYDPPTGYTERLEASESERHKSEPQKRVGAGKNKQNGGGREGAGASRKAKDKKQVKKHGKNRSRYSDYDSD